MIISLTNLVISYKLKLKIDIQRKRGLKDTTDKIGLIHDLGQIFSIAA